MKDNFWVKFFVGLVFWTALLVTAMLAGDFFAGRVIWPDTENRALIGALTGAATYSFLRLGAAWDLRRLKRKDK